jgi:hypothetical protein
MLDLREQSGIDAGLPQLLRCSPVNNNSTIASYSSIIRDPSEATVAKDSSLTPGLSLLKTGKDSKRAPLEYKPDLSLLC